MMRFHIQNFILTTLHMNSWFLKKIILYFFKFLLVFFFFKKFIDLWNNFFFTGCGWARIFSGLCSYVRGSLWQEGYSRWIYWPKAHELPKNDDHSLSERIRARLYGRYVVFFLIPFGEKFSKEIIFLWNWPENFKKPTPKKLAKSNK